MNRTLILILLVAAAAGWTAETIERERLTKRLDELRQNTRALGRVQLENERLRRIQPFAGEIESLRRDRVEIMGLRRELSLRAPDDSAANPEAALAALGREILPMGLWLPTAFMPDLGRSTPHAALQTAFWAARSGQEQALKEVLAFEPAVRPQAEAIIAGLPESLGLEQSSPELLVARALTKQPPRGEVQLVAEQLKGFDEAIEFVVLRSPGGETRATHLRLRWEQGGWRIVVPAHAVESAGRELQGAPAVPPPDPWRAAPRLPEP